MSKIIGIPVGTPLNPNVLREKLNPVTSVNGVKADENGDVKITIPDSGGNVDLTGVVRSVNGVTPDENGNVEIAVSGVAVETVEPAEDDIPKVFFTGDTTGMNKSTAVDLAFEYRSKTAKYAGVANMKWQGSSSLSYPEKNYTIKLFTDATKSEKLKLNMKGWGKENKFCLKANYVDTLHLRNLVGARIAYDMIKNRSDFNSLPTEMQNAPRCGVVDGFPVKVFINGVLQGIYTWNIPKDKWMMNMDDENANHAFLMAEKNNNGNSATTDSLVLACEFRHNATIFADVSEAQYPPYDWVVEGPGDDVTADIRASFNALIDCVKDTDDATFKTTIGNHLDLTSAFDYYCFAYLLCHYDGLGKNLGMATYDGQKWFCILYDMDSTFGAKIDGSGFLATNRRCPEEYQETNSLLWQRIESCFADELYARYLELRRGALSASNILTHAERFYDSIPTEYYAEDRSIWTGKPSKDTNTITRLRNYVVERAKYVDGEMLAIGSGENGDSNEPEVPTEVTLTSISASYSGGTVPVGTPVSDLVGITVIAEYSDGSTANVTGYTLSGSIAEGTNVITVSYNGKSATFTVTGENLGEVFILTDKKGIDFSTGNLKDSNSGTKALEEYYAVENGMRYIINFPDGWGWVAAYDASKNFVKMLCNDNVTFANVVITDTNIAYIRWGCSGGSGVFTSTVTAQEIETVEGMVVSLSLPDLDTVASKWVDKSNSGIVFNLSGTPTADENGLRMTSCVMESDKPITLNGAFTINIGICFDEVTATTGMFFGFTNATDFVYGANVKTSGLNLNCYAGDTGTNITFAPDTLVSLTIVRNANNTLVYKDGVLQGTYAKGNFGAIGDYYIKISNHQNIAKFNIKTLRVYNYELSADEVAALD